MGREADSDGGATVTPAIDDRLVTIRYSVIVFRGGELCLTSTTDRVDPVGATALQNQREAQTVRQWESLASRGDIVQVCPGAAGTVPYVSAALAFAEEVQGRLPRPQLSMPPGSAVAGQPMYLVNDQDLTYGETQVVDLGGFLLPVTVEAVGTWRVEAWGDGSPGEGPFAERSVGHRQDGLQVLHTYAEDADLAIAVVDTWTITVSAPGLPAMTLPSVDLAPSGLPVLVEQLQAVRNG